MGKAIGKKKKKESMEEKLYNLQAQQLAAQVANWAATLEFQKERFRLLEMPQFQQGLQLEVDKFAWQKAQETWERGYQEALLTGTYEGKPTTQWLMDQARLTGTFNGERTLEGKLTDAQIQDMHDKMKLANDQFLAATTGMFNGQKTFDREKFEAAQALEGWKFIATLSGPQNAFKQARAIANAPGGITQLMDAFAGQYMLPGSSAVGSGGAGGANPAGQLDDMRMGWGGTMPPPTPPPAPTTPSPPPGGSGQPGGSLTYAPIPGRGFAPEQWNQATRESVAAWEASNPGYKADGSQVGWRWVGLGGQAPAQTPATSSSGDAGGTQDLTWNIHGGYTYSPPGTQAPVNTYNYSGTPTGQVGVYPPGVASPPQTADVSTTTPVSPLAVAPVVNAPYQYGGTQTIPGMSGSMPLPSQINAENYGNSYNYQKELLWAAYEDAGVDKGLAQESYIRSLPKYGGPTKGAVAF